MRNAQRASRRRPIIERMLAIRVGQRMTPPVIVHPPWTHSIPVLSIVSFIRLLPSETLQATSARPYSPLFLSRASPYCFIPLWSWVVGPVCVGTPSRRRMLTDVRFNSVVGRVGCSDRSLPAANDSICKSLIDSMIFYGGAGRPLRCRLHLRDVAGQQQQQPPPPPCNFLDV